MIRSAITPTAAHFLHFASKMQHSIGTFATLHVGRNNMTVKFGRFVLVCGVAFLSAMCSSNSSPTGPTATPSATPTPTPPPPAPVANGRVEVSVVPSPVPFSGQPITDAASCANSKNTWFYDQVLRETGGAEVTLRTRVDRFDGSAVNNLTGLSIVVPANGSVTLKSRWCSATAAEHSAQTNFTGADAHGNSVTVTGPVVPLMKQ